MAKINYEGLKANFKITFQEMADETGFSVMSVHSYYNDSKSTRVERLAAIEDGIEAIARKRIKEGLEFLGE